MAKTIINIPDEVMINRIVIETRADSIPQTKKTIEKPDENKPVIKEVPKARPKLKPAVVEPIINVPVKIIKPKIKVLN
ncbi:hypothetical protein [Solitalea koreensis]|nr:hypothetical protein [Solitalea koreensis]